MDLDDDCLWSVLQFLCLTDLFSTQRVCPSFLLLVRTALSTWSKISLYELPYFGGWRTHINWAAIRSIKKRCTGVKTLRFLGIDFHIFPQTLQQLTDFLAAFPLLEDLDLQTDLRVASTQLLQHPFPSKLKHLEIEYDVFRSPEHLKFHFSETVQLTHLTKLELKHLLLDTTELCTMLNDTPTLNTLNIDRCTFTTSRHVWIEEVARLPNITELGFYGRVDAHIAACIVKKIPNLKILAVSVPEGDLVPISLLSAMKQLSHSRLQHLFLDVFTMFPSLVEYSEHESSTKNLTNWDEIPHVMFPCLKSLSLGYGIRDCDLRGITKGMPNLSCLKFFESNITADGVNALACVPLKTFIFSCVNTSAYREIYELLNDKSMFPLMDAASVAGCLERAA